MVRTTADSRTTPRADQIRREHGRGGEFVWLTGRECAMDEVRKHRVLAAATIVAALAAGALGATARPVAAAESDCVGQHVSEMARTHGGMAAATEHHNAMHGGDLGVGEHLALIRAECAG